MYDMYMCPWHKLYLKSGKFDAHLCTSQKVPMFVWWSIRGVVKSEVLKPGKIVNADLYYEQVDLENQSVIEKYLAIVSRKNVISAARQRNYAR